MKKPALIVLMCLVVLVGVVGCSAATLPSVAEVTGFRSVSIPAEGSPGFWPRHGPRSRKGHHPARPTGESASFCGAVAGGLP